MTANLSNDTTALVVTAELIWRWRQESLPNPCLPNYTASHPRAPYSSYWIPWEI